uniref:BTB domain-containing protein n=1 Tax=Strongyloides papillosus TaxID=174720 RepID=A0A0N5BTL8_STREA
MSTIFNSSSLFNKIKEILKNDTLLTPDIKCMGSTQCKPGRLSHTWTIDNFRSVCGLSEHKVLLQSEIFASNLVPELKWRMCILPQGEIKGSLTYGFLYMEVISLSRNEKFLFKAKHKYVIKDRQSGNELISDTFVNTIFPRPNDRILRSSIFCFPLHRTGIYSSENGSLDILCDIEIISSDKGLHYSEESVKPPLDNVSHYMNYISKFKKMYDSSDKTDCQIICEGEVLKVHKFMLISHSSVFYAMFEHKGTKEAKENTIKIVDTELPTLKMMIDYIYTGTIPELLDDNETINLLQLADKYDIQPLNRLCQDRLIFHLTESNVCELLKISDACKAHFLRDVCIRLVARNLKKIVNSREWLEMENTHPLLLYYVMKQALQYGS